MREEGGDGGGGSDGEKGERDGKMERGGRKESGASMVEVGERDVSKGADEGRAVDRRPRYEATTTAAAADGVGE